MPRQTCRASRKPSCGGMALYVDWEACRRAVMLYNSFRPGIEPVWIESLAPPIQHDAEHFVIDQPATRNGTFSNRKKEWRAPSVPKISRVSRQGVCGRARHNP